MRIALLEDDPDQADLVSLWLGEAGYQCAHYAAGRRLMSAAKQESYDLMILDWKLPDLSGIEVLAWLRANLDWPIPVLFVTQMDTEDDVVRALEAGADDYMTKPVRERELLARVAALSRRAVARETEQQLAFGNYRFDLATQQASLDGAPVSLTGREFSLATFLFRNHGRVLSRGHILESVWGSSSNLTTRKVDTHVSRIRSKLGIRPENGWQLRAIYQHGYRLSPVDDGTET